ncbi:ARL14 effector protein-like isoform X1 [Glandiceps talaboti]
MESRNNALPGKQDQQKAFNSTIANLKQLQLLAGSESTDINTATDCSKLGELPLNIQLVDENGDKLAINPHQSPAEARQATQRLLRSLQFKNPGPLSYSFACFNPETSEREMRKLRRVMHPENASRQKPKKSTIYDDSGRLIEDGRDLCDCLDDLCPGCHYPCPQCESTKCGSECRCNRRWLYEQIEVEGSGEVIKFHSSKSGHNKRS